MTALAGAPEGEEALAPLVDYVESLLGARFDGIRRAHLLTGLKKIMSRNGAASAEEFLELLDVDDRARDDLLAVATVGETYFFRHPEQLKTFRELILPELDGGREPRIPLRLWSAGCASGEEPYTLAMLLEDAGVRNVSILGTDVSPAALAKAAVGLYRPWSLRGQEGYSDRFEWVGEQFQVPARVRTKVEFRNLNLLHDPHPADVDVIFCRNVLMYFGAPYIGEVVTRLTRALRPGGWLVTAPADPALPCADRLEPVVTPGGIMYRRLGNNADKPSANASPETSARSPQARKRPPRRWMSTEGAASRSSCGDRHPVAAAAALEALDSGHYEAAAVCAEQAIAAGMDSPAMRAVRARALGNSGRVEEAERAARAATEAFPLDAELRYLHAELLIEDNDPEAAAEQASAAVYLDPTLGVAHLILGRAHLACGRTEAASRAFRSAGRSLGPPGSGVSGDASMSELSIYAKAYERMASKRAAQ